MLKVYIPAKKISLTAILLGIGLSMNSCSDKLAVKEFKTESTAAAPEQEIKKAPYVVHTTDKKTDLIRGDVATSDMTIKVDPKTKSIRLQGRVILKNKTTLVNKEAQITLEGNYDDNGFANLKPTDKNQDTKDLKIRSKATCLDYTDSICKEVVADIFVQDLETNTFHISQVKTKKPETKEAPPASKIPVPKGPVQPTPKTPDDTHKDDNEVDAALEGTPDYYVGQTYTNFEDIFDDKKNRSEKIDLTRPYDQAQKEVNNGELKKASNLLARVDEFKKNNEDPFVEIRNQARHRYFGTFELVELVLKMGKITKDLNLGYKLQVSDLSQKNGGQLGGSQHVSHQNGLDADIGFFTNDITKELGFPTVVSQDKLREDFLADKTLRFFQNMMIEAKGGLDRIFVNKTIKVGLCKKAVELGLIDKEYKTGDGIELLRRLRPWAGHMDHFHMRIKCSKYQPRCRQMSEPPSGSGC